jgi:hypothetical protein
VHVVWRLGARRLYSLSLTDGAGNLQLPLAHIEERAALRSARLMFAVSRIYLLTSSNLIFDCIDE